MNRRRVCVLLVVFVLYLQWGHLVNTWQGQGEEYRGGLIDDLKYLKCYRWYRQCNSIRLGGQLWLRIHKDLPTEDMISLQSNWFSRTFLYVRKARAAPVSEIAFSRDPKVVPLQVLQDMHAMVMNSDSSAFHGHGGLLEGGEEWMHRGGGVWCRHRGGAPPVTNIELYVGAGFVEARQNWKEVLHELSRPGQLPLSITRQVLGPEDLVAPEIGDSFKIMQITDTHLRGTMDPGTIRAEFQTRAFISSVLARENPDFVVITGDLLDGWNSVDCELCVMKLVQPMILAKKPFVILQGTSDFSTQCSEAKVLNFVRDLPLCVNAIAPHGLALRLWHGARLMLHWGAKGLVENESAAPEVDYSLAFMHGPLPEYRPQGVFPLVGSYRERVVDEKLLEKESRGVYTALVKRGVQVVSCGSEHNNDCCLKPDNGIWLCFAGVSGVGAERMEGVAVTVRMFKVDDEKGEITTWKRLAQNPEVVDYQVVATKRGEHESKNSADRGGA
ncbi:SIA1 (YOR137C) [Zygosaccharomyces parabailii]|nr:SIA1 (YOR137C) [Zygosaccharomyces parabailii]